MTKGPRGKTEAKKPKKLHVPNPPGLPASLAPTAASLLRPKTRQWIRGADEHDAGAGALERIAAQDLHSGGILEPKIKSNGLRP